MPSIRHLKTEVTSLLHSLIWSLGILNAETNPIYSDHFVELNGINIILDAAQQYF